MSSFRAISFDAIVIIAPEAGASCFIPNGCMKRPHAIRRLNLQVASPSRKRAGDVDWDSRRLPLVVTDETMKRANISDMTVMTRAFVMARR